MFETGVKEEEFGDTNADYRCEELAEERISGLGERRIDDVIFEDCGCSLGFVSKQNLFCARGELTKDPITIGAPYDLIPADMYTASTVKTPAKAPTNAHHHTRTLPIRGLCFSRCPSHHDIGFGRR